MITISALQHVYANVEREQSPRGRGGFQTLFRSSGLTDADVARIESRLVYHTSDDAPRKRLFFGLQNGMQVIGQLVPLSEPDRSGRKGRYLAHSLAIRPEEFQKIGNDPFAILNGFPFLTSVADALACGDLTSGSIPPATVDADLACGPSPELKGWDPEELIRLALSAIHEASHGGRGLRVGGSPDDVESVVAAALRLVPPAWRDRCSFDTYFLRVNPLRMSYWAMGYPKIPSRQMGTLVDAQTKQVLIPEPVRPESGYETWVQSSLRTQQVASVLEDAPAAASLCNWIEGRGSLHEVDAREELFESVGAIYGSRIRMRLERDLPRSVGPSLVQRGFGSLASPGSWYRAVRILQGQDVEDFLLEPLWRAYAHVEKAPDRKETEQLLVILRRHAHRSLKAFAMALSGNPGALREALALLQEDQYRQVIRCIHDLKLADARDLIVAGKGHWFLDEMEKDGHPPAEAYLVETVRALVETREDGCLDRLRPYLPGASQEALEVMARDLSHLADDNPFAQVVRQHLAPPEDEQEGRAAGPEQSPTPSSPEGARDAIVSGDLATTTVARGLGYEPEQVWLPASERIAKWSTELRDVVGNDRLRMATFRAAIDEMVEPGMTVLHLGTGDRTLGQRAIDAGADHVYGFGTNEDALKRAVYYLTSGPRSWFHPTRGSSFGVGMPKHVDLIVAEPMGSLADNGDLLGILNVARRRFLANDGLVLPRRVESYLVPVAAGRAHELVRTGDVREELASRSLDEALRSRGIRNRFQLPYDAILGSSTYLSTPRVQRIYSFESAENGVNWGNEGTTYRVTTVYAVCRDGVLTGFKGFFVATLSETVALDISGDDIEGGTTSDSWKHCYLPIEHPVEVRAGDRIRLAFSRANWTDSRAPFRQIYRWEGHVLRDRSPIARFGQSTEPHA